MLELLLPCWALPVLLLDLVSLPTPAGQTPECPVSPAPPEASPWAWSGCHRRWHLRLGTSSTALIPLVGSLLPLVCAFAAVNCWKTNDISKKTVSLAGYLTWWPVPHTAGGGQAKCNGAGDAVHQTCVPHWQKHCPALPCRAQRRCLSWSRIHWLSSALDPAVVAWGWLAWEGVGYRVVRPDRRHTDGKELNLYRSLLFDSLQIPFWGRKKKNHVLRYTKDL